MSGHHQWSELTKHFTPEDREIVTAGADEVVADSDRREREAARTTGKVSGSPQGGTTTPSAQVPYPPPIG